MQKERSWSLDAAAPERGAGRLPDFVVVGTTKGGTTSLDFYLGQHPEIFMARPKEPMFFIGGTERSRWERGVEWYRGQFVTDKRLCGEATPSYSMWPSRPLVAERMHAVIPGARLIYLVREPMARLRSEYLMEYRLGGTPAAFAEYLEEAPYALDASRYGTQVGNFLRFFPLERVLVIESAELLRHRQATMVEVFRFLGVDEGFSTPLFHHRRNVSKGQMFPSPMGRAVLDSRAMQAVRRHVPPQVFYHLRNAVTLPFRVAPPSTELPEAVERRLREEMRSEMQMLRELTGLALPSLDAVG